MHTLKLVQITDQPDIFLIEETDDDGVFLDTYYLDGASGGWKNSYTILAEVGEQEDEEDTDAFWASVDTAIEWIARNVSVKEAWKQFFGAYRHVLTESDCAEQFKDLIDNSAKAAEGIEIPQGTECNQCGARAIAIRDRIHPQYVVEPLEDACSWLCPECAQKQDHRHVRWSWIATW